MNEPPPEPLSNRQPKGIYLSPQIRAKEVSLDKGPDREFSAAEIMTKRTDGLGRLPGKGEIFQQKKVSQTSARAESLAKKRQKIEMEQKCVERRKRCKNASVRCENASVPDKKDGKDKRAKIIEEEIFKRRVVDMEHHNQHFKTKAYYKSSNDQRSINTHQEKVDTLKEATEAECEYGRQKMHCMEEDMAEKRNNSSETVAETRCDARHQNAEMEYKVYAKAEKSEEMRRASCRQSVEILDEEKEKVAEVQRLDSRNMDEKMADMQEKLQR